MPKIYGLKVQEGVSKKSGKEYKAVIVHYTEEHPPKSGGLGIVCDNEFVMRDVFDRALEGRTMESVISCECTFYYSKGGFLNEMVIEDKPAKG